MRSLPCIYIYIIFFFVFVGVFLNHAAILILRREGERKQSCPVVCWGEFGIEVSGSSSYDKAIVLL